ncbi:hypothetical protein GCM10009558_059460 [Virgisporangium aurantiacum]
MQLRPVTGSTSVIANVSLMFGVPNVSRAAAASAVESTSPPVSTRRSRNSAGPTPRRAAALMSSARYDGYVARIVGFPCSIASSASSGGTSPTTSARAPASRQTPTSCCTAAVARELRQTCIASVGPISPRRIPDRAANAGHMLASYRDNQISTGAPVEPVVRVEITGVEPAHRKARGSATRSALTVSGSSPRLSTVRRRGAPPAAENRRRDDRGAVGRRLRVER